MKLDVTIKTIVTSDDEWDILYKAYNVLNQLCTLLGGYNNEYEIVSCALDHLEEVLQNVIDDYELK